MEVIELFSKGSILLEISRKIAINILEFPLDISKVAEDTGQR